MIARQTTRTRCELLTDEQLCARALGESGDAEAVEALMRRAATHARFAVRAMDSNVDALDDLVQDVVTKAWISRHQFDPERGRYSTWISRIARNSVISSWRAQHARPRSALCLDEHTPLPKVVEDSLTACPSTVERPARLMLDAYCARRTSQTEALAVAAVLEHGYRIADLKRQMPSCAGSIDRWVRDARRYLRTAIRE